MLLWFMPALRCCCECFNKVYILRFRLKLKRRSKQHKLALEANPFCYYI